MHKKTLLQLSNGVSAKVTEFLGGRGFVVRMESMGIRKGVMIKKISDASGPVVVSVGRFHLAIGRGMAAKIIVEEQ